MADMKPKRGLGRGLSALLDDVAPKDSAPPRPSERTAPIELLRPNPDQPRRRFDQADLDELTASIAAKGVIQPLVVRPDPEREGAWQIVAGERRWRAAQAARVHEVPIVVRDLSDEAVLELGIIENVQRADLTPLEEAQGYAALIDRFGHTQEKLAEVMGKSRSHLANALRLLNLPEDVKTMLDAGQITAGHARAVLTSADPSGLARDIAARGLSVREAERLAKAARIKPGMAPPKRGSGPEKDADTRALEADLSAALGLKVTVDHTGAGGGVLSIRYSDLDQLDGLCQLLSQS